MTTSPTQSEDIDAYARLNTPSNAASPISVRLSTTGAIALGSTLLFYLVLGQVAADTAFGQIWMERGWVPYVISFLSLWSGSLLVMKWRRLVRLARVLEFDLLPRTLGDSITRDNAAAFLSFLQNLTLELGQSYASTRLIRALEHFGARGQVAETVEQLRAQAERDDADVEAGYTMLRVFIWAIPILGFIGTVIGIGASVAGFSESVAAAATLEVMKDSIGSVTSGLGIAFDTTLLALVMSIFIMFPTSSLQQAEEEHLAAVEHYCQRHLVARLDGDRESEARIDDATLTRAVALLAEQLAEAVSERLRPPE